MGILVAAERSTVLVTGGAGYIGSHACKALARAGYLPIAADNLVEGHDWAVRWGPLEVGDLNDRSFLDSVMARYRPGTVMHFAAFAYVGESMIDPGKYYRNNVAGTLTLLEAMRDNQVEHLVLSSSCATYGIPDKVPIVEDMAQRPINPYGASKLMIERMIADFESAHAIRSVALRYFNAAGADPDGELGESHNPETHLIPLALNAATRGGPPLSVFGSDYDTSDGTCVRDYVHVSDLADAHLAALNWLNRNSRSRAFNLGTGAGASVLDVIKAVEHITGRPVPYRLGPRREGDPPVLVSDASRAAAELRWRPTRSDLETIVSTAWKWQQARV